MTDMYHTDIRVQLHRLGYEIIPARGKLPGIKGWNTQDFLHAEMHEARISRWGVRFPYCETTGVRLTPQTGALDRDVNHQEVQRLLGLEILRIAPQLVAAPQRGSEGTFKLATFFQPADEGEERRYVRMATRKWRDPATGEEHAVEAFAGKATRQGRCSRHMSVTGPRAYGPDGTVTSSYFWCDGAPALHEMAAADVPVVRRTEISDILGAAERLFAEAGWVPLADELIKDSSDYIYNIDDTTLFETEHHGDIDYAELASCFDPRGEDIRCSSSFTGDGGTNRSKCKAVWSFRHKCVAVYNFETAIWHLPATRLPADPAELARQLQQLPQDGSSSGNAGGNPDGNPGNPSGNPGGNPGGTAGSTTPLFGGRCLSDADLMRKTQELLKTHGYCAGLNSVIELDEPGDECTMRLAAFQCLFRSWYVEVKGPRGGISHSYATSLWELDARRINVRGIRMHPGKSFPVFDDNGALWKNTYCAPQHTGTGDIAPWLEFIAHLLPDEIEREWFCNWLAHKQRHPDIPGVAVIMVATGPDGPVYGTGRGFLRDILARLYGPRYVKPIDFDVFTGSSAQGVYTDWGAYAVLVTVSESKDTPDSMKWAERRAVYERLREIVDPRAIERTFTSKGRPSFTALAHASYLIFSNNKDAVQIPSDDRRMTALRNGVRMPAAMAAALQVWLEQPGNIAELARWLERRDLTGFNMYEPLLTETKAIMQKLAGSELDDAFAIIRRKIGRNGLFTGEQVRMAVALELGEHQLASPLKWAVNRVLRAEATQVGEFRLTPLHGRHKILGWRGREGSWTQDEATARLAVESTARLLAKDAEGMGSFIAASLLNPE